MRSLLVAAALVPVLALGACSGGDDEPSSAPGSPSAPPSLALPTLPTGPPQTGGAGSRTCAEVVAGIDAFNAGDFDETVEHFEKAVPLARTEDDGSVAARLLIEAVEYYAALPPADYLDAAATSPEFARWKAVTLGQCAGDGGGGEGGDTGASQDPGVPA